MSNIIRANHLPTTEKKLIQTKKITRKIAVQSEQEIDPIIRKQQLLDEIATLESRYQEIKEQMTAEKTTAEAEIAQWWQDKQQEAIELAEKKAETASKAGYDEGYQQGLFAAEQAYESKIQEAENVIQAAHLENKKIIQAAEAFLLELSVKIAEKVIKTQISLDHQKLVEMVKGALKQMEESEEITIQVSPEDYPILLPFVDELQTYVRADGDLKVIPSTKLSPGGCMIHTPSGSYDVAVDSQLNEVRKQLLSFFEEKMNHAD